jgi:hypothetical protein
MAASAAVDERHGYSVAMWYPIHASPAPQTVDALTDDLRRLVVSTDGDLERFAKSLPEMRRYLLHAVRKATLEPGMILPTGQTCGEFAFWYLRHASDARRKRRSTAD